MDNVASITSQNIKTNNPIQVRKVSQLTNYTYVYDYCKDNDEENKLSNTGAYLMVGYPNHNIPNVGHNFKINLEDISKMSYTYSAPLVEEYVNNITNNIYSYFNKVVEDIYKTFNDKFTYLMVYLDATLGSNSYLGKYWNNEREFVIKYWNSEEN